MKNKFNSKIIIACDFNNETDLNIFLNHFKNKKLFLKLGMQIVYKLGFDIITKLKNLGHNIFLDLKLYDTPNTISNAVLTLAKYNPDFITVHLLGGLKMLSNTQDQLKNYTTELIGVTVLTSTSNVELQQIFNQTNNKDPNLVNQVITNLITIAKKANINNFVASASKVNMIKKNNPNAVVFCPGIILDRNNIPSFQHWISTPLQAKKLNADYIIIGRSLTNSSNILKTYLKIEKEFNCEQ